MFFLDTDIVSLLGRGHPKVTHRVRTASETIGTTVVTRIEILLARFDFLLKAADGPQLERAQHWLDQSEADLRKLHLAMVDSAAAAEFDKLRKQKKLKKIGRRDLLIGCIALAHQATLVTRNVKHFRQIPHLKLENWAD